MFFILSFDCLGSRVGSVSRFDSENLVHQVTLPHLVSSLNFNPSAEQEYGILNINDLIR